MIFALSASAQEGSTTRPAEDPVGVVPSAAAVDAARKALRQELGLQFANADAAEKRRLAHVLLRRGSMAMVEPAERMACLAESRDLFVAMGQASGAVACAREMQRWFGGGGVGGGAVGGGVEAVLDRAGKNAKGKDQLLDAYKTAIELAREAEGTEQYAGAMKLAGMAEQYAGKAGDVDAEKEAVLLGNGLKESSRLHGRYLAAQKKLEEDGQDAGANQAAGEYLCLVRGVWSRGLLHLTRGSDTAMRAAAEADLGATSAEELAAAAEAWWQIGLKRGGGAGGIAAGGKSTPGRAVLQRCRALYERALPGLNGKGQESLRNLALQRVAACMEGLDVRLPIWAGDEVGLRSRLGAETWRWVKGLEPGVFAIRDDDVSTVYSRGVVELAGDGTEPMPGSKDGVNNGSEGETKLTYKLSVLCLDEAGAMVVLQREGTVQFTSDGKAMRLSGPRHSDIRRLNQGKAVPEDAHLQILLGDETVWQSLWKDKPKKAWWLDQTLLRD